MEKIKNIGFAAWKDPYGWMEAMKGPQWQKLLHDNKKKYDILIQNYGVQEVANSIQYEMMTDVSYVEPLEILDMKVEQTGTFNYKWSYVGGEESYNCADLDFTGHGNVWTAEDTSNGSEQYTLKHISHGKTKWKHERKVGPFVAVQKNLCFSIESEKFLWFRRVISVDAKTGKNRKVILELDDPEWNMDMSKGQNGCLFVTAVNGGKQRLWYITDKGEVKDLTGPYESFVPIGFSKEGNDEPCYFARRVGADTYEPVGAALEKLSFPDMKKNIPQYFCFKTKEYVTRSYGKRSLWKIGEKSPVLTVIGNIGVLTHSNWKLGIPNFLLMRPGFDTISLHDFFSKKMHLCPYADSEYKMAKSKDGTSIPYVYVSSCEEPIALFCYVYGSYGIPTGVQTNQYKSLLKRGFALCFSFVRGGGDHDDAWAQAARCENKNKTMEDFEACIRACQKRAAVGSQQTIIYGRSAGGYAVGSMVALHSKGGLFGAAYAEVPYVDVLNTVSNPDLPLTMMEYNEFGDPRRIQDIQALVNLSPIHALPEDGAPHIFVLARSGVNDKEVYAYEPAKWITKLQDLDKKQKHPEPKILAMEGNQGHFVVGNLMYKQKSEDFALLIGWLSSHTK